MNASSRDPASAPDESPVSTPAAPRRTQTRVGDRSAERARPELPEGPGQPVSSRVVIEPGAVIAGKYRLTRLIGAGGMGAVWAAVNESLGSDVALKFLLGRSLDREHAQRFVAEAKMAAAIKHRFVVDTFDFGSMEDGTPYMVLELLKGEELAQRLQHGPALPVKDAVRLIAQCLSGLEAVHAAGIVHRDLKPENVFVISDSDWMFPKLIDFGVAMAAAVDDTPVPGGGKRLTQAGVAVGTPAYMAPEQLRAQRDLDQRADLYAMGVVLFEMLVGSPPFVDDNAADLMVKIATRGVPALSTLRPELGTEISDVIARALAKDREQRFANAAEMRAALHAVIPRLPDDALTIVQDSAKQAAYGNQTALQLQSAQDPFAEPVPESVKTRAGHFGRWAVGAAVAAAALIAGWMWMRGSQPQLNQATPSCTRSQDRR